jgi:hypothetical protein
MQCIDTDKDGCVELVRKECGRKAGCALGPGPGADVACAALADSDAPLNLFGAQIPGQDLPAGFVGTNTTRHSRSGTTSSSSWSGREITTSARPCGASGSPARG